MRFVQLGSLCAVLLAVVHAVEFELHDSARKHIRSNIERTHVQYPLYCPECFSALLREENEYLVCDFQIVPHDGEHERGIGFMLNGHYVPEYQFESQADSNHIAKPRGITEAAESLGHQLTGTLHYETILQKGEVNIKGVQLNLSEVADHEGSLSYGLRISYARSPSPRIIRIAQMEAVDDPFPDAEEWVNPPDGLEFQATDKLPIEETYIYGWLKNYGHECDMTSCRAHDLKGLVSDKFNRFRGDMSQRLLKFQAECRDPDGPKPVHCRVYEQKIPTAFVVLGVLVLFSLVMRRTCRACCICLFCGLGRRNSIGSHDPLMREEMASKEV